MRNLDQVYFEKSLASGVEFFSDSGIQLASAKEIARLLNQGMCVMARYPDKKRVVLYNNDLIKMTPKGLLIPHAYIASMERMEATFGEPEVINYIK